MELYTYILVYQSIYVGIPYKKVLIYLYRRTIGLADICNIL